MRYKKQDWFGTKRWVNLNAKVCPTVGETALTKCKFLKAGDEITVESGSADYLGRESYLVRLADGTSGWMDEFALSYETIDEAERKKNLAAKADCDRRGGVSVGMTANQVLASCWGKPEKVNATITAGGRREQWVYGSQYVYVDNGTVTAIQTSGR